MKPEILEFLNSQRVCALAIEMLDGSPHVSTMHFANKENPLLFIFETDRPYRKGEALLNIETSRASLVIGFEEGYPSSTFQLDGITRLLKDSEQKLIDVYLQKFPNKKEKAMDPENLFFIFTPTWWRFTSWSKENGKETFTSI